MDKAGRLKWGRWNNFPGGGAMAACGYLMESAAVAIRLDVKTDGRDAEKQAFWAGLKPGMRVADLDCNCLRLLFITPEGRTAFRGGDVLRRAPHLKRNNRLRYLK